MLYNALSIQFSVYFATAFHCVRQQTITKVWVERASFSVCMLHQIINKDVLDPFVVLNKSVV